MQWIPVILLFCLGQAFAWFTTYSQFAWEFWSDKFFLAQVVFGIPAGMAFWTGAKMCLDITPEAWTARLVAFAASYFVFPLFTWWFMNETPFTMKTFICTLLAFSIVFIQIFWK